MKIIKSENLFASDKGGIKSKYLFSFGEYLDHSNMNLWHVRVMNDDIIEAKSGVPMHPHNYYEVVTVMLDGEMTHEDNFGNKETLGKNQIQVMNTGSGIEHSEMNNGSKNVKMYQLWLAPGTVVPQPSYYTAKYKPKDIKNNLYKIATGIEGDEAENTLISPVSIHRWIFDEGESVTISYEKHILVYVTSGEAALWANIISKNDQLINSLWGTVTLNFNKKTEIFVILSN